MAKKSSLKRINDLIGKKHFGRALEETERLGNVGNISREHLEKTINIVSSAMHGRNKESWNYHNLELIKNILVSILLRKFPEKYEIGNYSLDSSLVSVKDKALGGYAFCRHVKKELVEVEGKERKP